MSPTFTASRFAPGPSTLIVSRAALGPLDRDGLRLLVDGREGGRHRDLAADRPRRRLAPGFELLRVSCVVTPGVAVRRLASLDHRSIPL